MICCIILLHSPLFGIWIMLTCMMVEIDAIQHFFKKFVNKENYFPEWRLICVIYHTVFHKSPLAPSKERTDNFKNFTLCFQMSEWTRCRIFIICHSTPYTSSFWSSFIIWFCTPCGACVLSQIPPCCYWSKFLACNTCTMESITHKLPHF